MPAESLIAETIRAVRVTIAGRVQGLGVRPAVARLGRRCRVAGSVKNTADGLSIEVEGAPQGVTRFLDELAGALPPGTVVEHSQVEPVEPSERQDFVILPRGDERAGAAAVPLDRVVCDDCLAEVRTPGDRRHGYPFTSCTACGPRYSIIAAMPYDRPATTMRAFTLCPACDAEYRADADRRFHAQTNACPQCGPQVWLTDDSGSQIAVGSAALSAAATALREGRIVALKGIGGYQLLVDATSSAAVRCLRTRKQRRAKPLAVMVGNLAEAERIALLNDTERRLLAGPAGPIVVVRRRSDASLAPEIAPELDTCGLMLATTPLHALLLDLVGRPLVATSGNREGGALAYDPKSAGRELSGLADLWLHHDRTIERPIDDSVIRVIAGEPCILRLARGLAPHVLPLPGNRTETPIIALGGEQKSAIALTNGAQAILGPHVGDLSDAEVCQRWGEQIDSLAPLYGVSLASSHLAHDAHPDYYTTRWAQQRGVSRQAVYHHHAHVAAVMLEHGLLDREVVGLAWDGTGYGVDGTIWGSECLRVSGAHVQRLACLRPFPLPGGDLAVRQPWRIAVALVCEAMGPDAARRLDWPEVAPAQIDQMMHLAARPRLAPMTSSMGRLFDGIAALALGIATSEDDGRPAMLLESVCERSATGNYSLPWNRAEGIADWRPLVIAVIDDLRRGTSPGVMAMRFHRAVAAWGAELSAAYANLPLVTSGGVFQNAVLGELLAERIATRRSGWFRPRQLPPGDGGLAAGQLAVAAARRPSFS